MTYGASSSIMCVNCCLDLGRKIVSSYPFRMLMNLFYLALILFRMIMSSSTCSVFSSIRDFFLLSPFTLDFFFRNWEPESDAYLASLSSYDL